MANARAASVIAPHGQWADAVPLSVNQEAMWVTWRLDPGRVEHVVPMPLAVTGKLDVPRLRHAVAWLARRHPVLASRVLTTVDGVSFTTRDARPIPVTERTVTADRDTAIRAAATTRLDLDRGPLAAIEVLRGPDYTIVLIIVHHIAFDGTSVAVLLDELRQGYAGASGRGPDDPAPIVRHAAWSRALADGPKGDAHRKYWSTALTDPPTGLALPAGSPDGAFHTVDRRIDPDTAARVRTLAQALDITPFTVAFGALFLLLRQRSGSDDQIVSAPFHNRTDPALASRIGFFANVLPFRARMTGSASCEQFLRDLRATVRAGMRHGELPLPALLRAAGLVGPDAHDITHHVVFEYWNAARDTAVIDVRRFDLGEGCALELLDVLDVADYALTVMLREDTAGMTMVWKDPAGRHSTSSLAELADDYVAVLRTMTADPTRSLDSVAPPRPVTPVATPRIRSASRSVDPSLLATVAEAWAQVLRIPAPSSDDSFFELGGHSLLATTLVDTVGARLGVPLNLSDLFDNPRLGDFAAIAADRSGLDSRAISVGPTVDGPVPASGFQQAIWLAERIDPGHADYVVPLAWQVTGTLDPDALRSALAGLVARQELLHTRFVDIDGVLHLDSMPPWQPDLHVVDLSDVPPDEQQRRLRDWPATVADRLSLSEGHLLAAALHTLGSDRQVLTLCTHHAVLDGGSVPVLLRELRRCYTATDAPPPPRYRDLLAAQHNRAADLDHWHRHLADAPVTLGLPAPAHAEPDGRVELPLAADLSARLAPVRADHQVSSFIVVIAAVAAVLHRSSGLADLTFGVPVAARGGAAFADVVGPAMNTMVLRSRCAPGATIHDLMLASRAEMVTAFEHVSASFEDVVARLRPTRAAGRTPYLDVLVNSVDQTDWGVELGVARLTPLPLADQLGVDSKVGITITMITSGGRPRVLLTHRGDLVGHADVHRMAGELAALLNEFADHLNSPVWTDERR